MLLGFLEVTLKYDEYWVCLDSTNKSKYFFFFILVTRAIRDSNLFTISVLFVRNVPDDDLAEEASFLP